MPTMIERHGDRARPPWMRGAAYAFDFTKQGRGLFAGAPFSEITALPGWSFSRASFGYAKTAAGLLVPFSSGQPRITDKGFLIEGSRTNLALYCRDLTNAAWTKSNVTAALTQIGADGVANSATKLTASANNGACLQSITDASAARAVSALVRRVTGFGSIFITADNDATRTDITSLLNSTGYAWCQFNQTLANPTVGFKIATSGDEIAVDFVQCEAGTGASSPILTTSASATRAADVVSLPLSIGYPLSLFAEFERAANVGVSQTAIQLDDGTTAERALLFVNTGNNGAATQVAGGVAQASVTGSAPAIDAVTRLAARFGLNDVQMAQGGVLGTPDTSATAPGAATTMRFGSNSAGASQSFGYLRRLAIYPRALLDAELQALTA